MSEIASAFVSIAPSAKGFGSKLGSQISGEVGSAGKRAGGVFGKAFGAIAAVGIGAAVASFVKTGVESLGRIERINAQTATVIKSTGGAAGITAKQIEAMSGRIENLTATEAETTQEGANLLLTFTNIRNEVGGKFTGTFDQATTTMVDMSRALGQDVKSSAVQLGKALNDPIKGVTALQRVGVSFTESQKAQIKTMVESGNTMGAQKLILAELDKEFGGSAEAFAKTTEGRVELAKHAFGTLQESIVSGLLPPLGTLATIGANALNGLAEKWPSIVAAIKSTVGPVIQGIADLFGGSSGLGASIQSFVSTAKANFQPVLETMARTFTGTVLPAVTSLVSYLAATLLPVFTQIAGIVKTQVVPIVASLALFFYGTLYPAVVKIAASVAQNLKPVFDQLVATFRSQVLPTLVVLLAKFREWQPTIEKIAAFILKLTGKLLELAAVIIGKVLPFVIRLVGFLVGNAIRAIAGVTDAFKAVTGVIGAVGDAFKGLWNKASTWLGKAMNFITGMPGKIKSAFSGIWSGLAEGLKAAVNSVLHLPLTIPRIDTHIPKVGVVGGQTLIPALAKGGPARRGQPYLVGEVGPELFVPDTSGLVVPNHRLTSGAHGAAGGRQAFVITNWDQGIGYMETIADSRVDAAAGLADEQLRAG